MLIMLDLWPPGSVVDISMVDNKLCCVTSDNTLSHCLCLKIYDHMHPADHEIGERARVWIILLNPFSLGLRKDIHLHPFACH